MTAYYNEIDPFAAAWLRELIKDGLIAPGDVDERSIEDVVPNDLTPYTQCHFFAGIGGWSYALRLAGWPDDRPVWTGSAPCQPFSEAGKGGGFADDRHLWPAFYWLISQCRPAIVFGEQVASKSGLEWWDVVATDLEASAYACAAFDLPAASAGAFHIRQRLCWVADTKVVRHIRRRVCEDGDEGHKRHEATERGAYLKELERLRAAGVAQGDASSTRLERRPGQSGNIGQELTAVERTGGGIWADVEWIICRDGKARPTRPGLFPLAHGVPNRMGTLCGAGNAIVPPLTAEFVRAYMEELPMT